MRSSATGHACFLLLLAASAASVAPARAEEDETPLSTREEVGVPRTEEPDPTRLDVARLPPEAAPLKRDLFARGGYLDVHLGARGFVGDVGEVTRPGPLLMIAGGYELASWFALGLAVAGSIHTTDAPSPPHTSSFETFEALAQLRLTWVAKPQIALWLRGEGGVFLSTGDVLRAHGFKQGDDVVPSTGGALGFDWHLRARHHSVGLEAGTRLLPGLELSGVSLSVHGTAYLHYVF